MSPMLTLKVVAKCVLNHSRSAQAAILTFLVTVPVLDGLLLPASTRACLQRPAQHPLTRCPVTANTEGMSNICQEKQAVKQPKDNFLIPENSWGGAQPPSSCLAAPSLCNPEHMQWVKSCCLGHPSATLGSVARTESHHGNLNFPETVISVDV